MITNTPSSAEGVFFCSKKYNVMELKTRIKSIIEIALAKKLRLKLTEKSE